MKLSELLGREDLKEKFVLQKFLCTFLSCSREALRTDMDKELPDELIQKILTAYKSYVEDKKPLEYILWHVDFFGREFFVNEATLIPRPETEYMITAATEFIQEQGTRHEDNGINFSSTSQVPRSTSHSNVLLDIGTGCWVLWISVLLQNPEYFSEAIFTDYFADALEIAKKNFENYKWEMINDKLNVQFLQSDLLDFIKSSTLKGTPSFEIKEDSNIVLVANLPYIPEKMFEENAADNVKKREPKPAFVGGDDGLDYYRIMLDQIIQVRGTRWKDKGTRDKEWVNNLKSYVLSPMSQFSLTCFLEMMTWQVDILRQLYDDKFVFEEVKTFHFNIRIVKCWLK